MSRPFDEIARVDARDKVLGRQRYAADDHRPNLAHAMLAVATIPRGKIVRVDTAAARSTPGVLAVFTHQDLSSLQSAGYLMTGQGFAFQSLQPLTSDAIAYRGQPIALVVADSLQAAIEGAALIKAEYEPTPHSATLSSPGVEIISQAASPLPKPMFADRVVGDADAALPQTRVRVDTVFDGPPQHQNPMELLATVAEWKDGTLTVNEPTQNAEAVRAGLARQFGLSLDKVRVLSASVGGGFGQKNSLQAHTGLVAFAARHLNRPVKLVVPRTQVFHDASFRPASRHKVQLGADENGRFIAAVHEVDHQTSRHDLFPAVYADVTGRLYGIANFRGHERLVRTDVQTPGYMRAPFEHIGVCAFESAVDELAYALGRDPVSLRLANDAPVDPLTGKPFTSRHVMACLQRGAAKFGWAQRKMAPRSMRAADGTLIGWGVAIGAYKAAMAPATARLRATNNGQITVTVGVHEMGQGVRTALANLLSAELRVPPESIVTVVGETGAVAQHLTAGSWGTATALNAAKQAASLLHDELARLTGRDARETPIAELLESAGIPSVEVEARSRAPGQPEQIFGRVAQGLPAAGGPVYPEFVSMSHVAHFVEVRVEPSTARIRVPRVVTVVDCGRVASPRTARSQAIGAVVWGMGAALREVSEVDARYGGFLNADIAEYVIPVNADIGTIDVDFIDEPDVVLNPAGVKGQGEVAMVGVAGAIVNAVFHATGRRIRHLPIRIEDVL